MNTASTVSKVWSFCNSLRDDGARYSGYLEQLTHPTSVKMADEHGELRCFLPAIDQNEYPAFAWRRGGKRDPKPIRDERTSAVVPCMNTRGQT